MRPRETHSGSLRAFPYVEAYPQLDIQSTYRAIHTRRQSIVWRDQTGSKVGVADIMWTSPDEVCVSSYFEDTVHLFSCDDTYHIPIVYMGSSKKTMRPFAVCAGCTRNVRYLVFKDDDWHCRHCHGLKNRTSLIGTKQRRTENEARLLDEIGGGRPSGWHQPRYERAEQSLRDLQIWLNTYGRSKPSAAYEFRVSADWVKSVRVD